MNPTIKLKFFIVVALIALFAVGGTWLIFHLAAETQKRIAIETRVELEQARGFVLQEIRKAEISAIEKLMAALENAKTPTELSPIFTGAFIGDFERSKIQSFSTVFYQIMADSLRQPFYQPLFTKNDRMLKNVIRSFSKTGIISNRKKLVRLSAKSEAPFFRLRTRHLLGLFEQRQGNFQNAIGYFNIEPEPNAAYMAFDDYLKAACLLERIKCRLSLEQFSMAAQDIDIFFEALGSSDLAELKPEAKAFFLHEIEKIAKKPEIDSLDYYFQSSREAYSGQRLLASEISLLSEHIDEFLPLTNREAMQRTTLFLNGDTVIVRIADMATNASGLYYPFGYSNRFLGLIYDRSRLIKQQIPDLLKLVGALQVTESEPVDEPGLCLQDGFPTVYLSLDPDEAAKRAQQVRQQTRTGLVILVFLIVISMVAILSLSWGLKRERELLRMQSDFLAAVSHDLKTPLALLKASAETLHLGRVPAKRLKWYFQTILDEANWLTALVENILDFSRLRRKKRKFKMESLQLHPIITEVISMAQQTSRDRKIIVSPTDVNCTIYADRTALRQVLFNLTENALKFSPAAESVRIDVTETDKCVKIEVIDNGPGIPDDEQKLIFDDFRQGSLAKKGGYRGSGLGLALVKRLVTGMGGGEVGCRPAPDGGSIFFVKLKH